MSLCEALKSNPTLTELDLESKDKRKKTRKRHPSTIHSFSISLHQQAMRLEKQGRHHWVRHWCQTQHSQNLVLIVNTKERHTKGIHQQITLFSFSFFQQGTSLETQEQHRWVKHWNQTQHSLSSTWGVKTKERRHTKDIHQQITCFFSLYLQVTVLEIVEQHRWAKHWNQTQHSLNSISKVRAKERRHTKDIHQQITLFNSLLINREWNRRHRCNVTEWSIEIKLNTHWAWSDD